MRRLAASLLLLVAFAACQTAAPPPPPEPEPVAADETALAIEEPIGVVRVTASSLNVRSEATTASPILASVSRGQRLSLVRGSGNWYKVRLETGVDGWVSAKHVQRERSCPPDAEFRFVETPTLSFSDSAAKGVVTVEVSVDATGKITKTRVTGNTTGDEALAFLAEREIRTAKFAAPVRNCKSMPFIYVYRKTF